MMVIDKNRGKDEVYLGEEMAAMAEEAQRDAIILDRRC